MYGFITLYSNLTSEPYIYVHCVSQIDLYHKWIANLPVNPPLLTCLVREYRH